MGPDYMEMEESVDETVDLSCSARGFPTPSLIWTASDGRVRHGGRASELSHRPRSFCLLGLLTRLCVLNHQNLETEPQETDGVIRSSIRFSVTSDVTVFCNVSNEYGADAVTFNIKTREFPVCPSLFCLCSSLRVPPSHLESVPGLVQRLFLFNALVWVPRALPRAGGFGL